MKIASNSIILIKSYKYRLYPTKLQAELIDKHTSAVRLVYNLALDAEVYYWKSQHKSISCNEMIKQLPELKQAYTWLYEINSSSLQFSIRNLYAALSNFWKHGARHPKYKSKYKSRLSVTFPAGNKITNNKLYIGKFSGGIKINLDRQPKGTLKSVTLSKSSTGKYYVSCNYDNQQEPPIKKSPINDRKTVGIDLGLKHFATLSNGQKIDNPRHLRSNIKLIKIFGKRLSRCAKGSNRYNRRKLLLARKYERITNLRNNFLHKLTSSLIDDFDTICIEDLQVSNMIKNHSLAQAIGDVSWHEFRRQLIYKAEWQGKNVIVINAFTPSSKLCSNCGYKNDSLELSDRSWICTDCSAVHDRDINAAINIREFGLNKDFNGRMTTLGRGDTAKIRVKPDSRSVNRQCA